MTVYSHYEPWTAPRRPGGSRVARGLCSWSLCPGLAVVVAVDEQVKPGGRGLYLRRRGYCREHAEEELALLESALSDSASPSRIGDPLTIGRARLRRWRDRLAAALAEA